MIEQKEIDRILIQTDIVTIVEQYVELAAHGESNFTGFCPFHEEKTPSFTVSLDKQIFKCFGCKKGGNVIKFIQEIEKASFPEAIAFLQRKLDEDC